MRALATQLCCCDAVAASMGWRWLLATAYAAEKKLKATRTKRLKCSKEAYGTASGEVVAAAVNVRSCDADDKSTRHSGGESGEKCEEEAG